MIKREEDRKLPREQRRNSMDRIRKKMGFKLEDEEGGLVLESKSASRSGSEEMYQEEEQSREMERSGS